MNDLTLILIENAVSKVYNNFIFRNPGSDQELDDISCFIKDILIECGFNVIGAEVIDKIDYDVYIVKSWFNNNPIEITANMVITNEELALSIFNELKQVF
jgi:hypothetical protein